jgi:hypothetical protein
MGTTAEQLRDGKQGAPEVTGRSSARRMTGSVGLAVAVLFAAGNALWALDQPEAGASSHQIVSFYSSTSSRIIAGASVSLLAAALLVFFASGVRTLLREHAPDDLLPSAAFGGLLLVVAAGLGAETINMAGALRAEHGQLTPELSRALFEISYVLGYNAAGVGIAVLLGAIVGVAWRSSSLLPRWTAPPLLLLAVAFLTPLCRLLLGPAIVLLAIVSIRLLLTARAELSTVKPASRSADRA